MDIDDNIGREERTSLLNRTMSDSATTTESVDNDAKVIPPALTHEHLKQLPVQGIGFLVDAYDLFSMTTVNVILSVEYPKEFTVEHKGRLNGAVFLGCIVGQILFGYLADRIGRARIFITTCIMLICGSLLCTITPYPFSFVYNAHTILWTLTIARFLLGIAIGGEYPLSATVASEHSHANLRGFQTALVHAGQGLGALLSCLFGLFLVNIYANQRPYKQNNLETIWRLLFSFGILPALCILPLRCKMKESKHFSRNKKKTILDKRHTSKMTPMSNVCWVLNNYGKRMIGTAGCWFINDIIFYGIGIWLATILLELENSNKPPSINKNTLRDVLTSTFIVAVCGLPWYFVSAFFIDRVGHRKMQLYGFLGLSITSCLFSLFYTQVASSMITFIVFLTILFAFLNLGSNTTTFIIASESYPSKIRATMHGISAAFGKCGAFIGASFFYTIKSLYGAARCFLLISLLSLIGLILTYFFINEYCNVDLRLIDLEYEEKLLQFAGRNQKKEEVGHEEREKESQNRMLYA